MLADEGKEGRSLWILLKEMIRCFPASTTSRTGIRASSSSACAYRRSRLLALLLPPLDIRVACGPRCTHALVEEKASLIEPGTAIVVPLATRVPDLGSQSTASIAATATTRCANVRAAASLIPRPVNTEVLITETAEGSPVGEFKSRAGGHLVPDIAAEVDKTDMGGCCWRRESR
jgi:hypothetical protein